MWSDLSEVNNDTTRITFTDFDCCDDIEEGKDVSGIIDHLQHWFEINEDFKICYDELCLNINDTTPTITSTTQPALPCLTEEIYGEESEETKLLRYFRDYVLSKTSKGRK